MAEPQPGLGEGYMAFSMEVDHTPADPSPLNPAARAPSKTPAPIQREQREKRETIKKREAQGSTPSTSTLGKRKNTSSNNAYPTPQRYNIPPPKAQDYEPPRDDMMAEHEPPIYLPNSSRQLYKPLDLAENKRGYRYQRAIADPLFPHKQYYRSTSPMPHYARLSFEDADRYMHFSTNALLATNEKGWRMARSNVCAREGTLYYEVKIHKGGVPQSNQEAGGAANGDGEAPAVGPQPHVRFGWARREAPLDSPVGFDGYSYGITDIRFETMHRSRPGKFFHAKKAGKSKGAKSAPGAAPTPVTLAPEDQHVKEGDVIGLEIQLPALSLHQKIVSGVYNPAVDIGDGFPAQGCQATALRGPDEVPLDIIRDRIPVSYKGNTYFEILDHVASKPMETYADRTVALSSLNSSNNAPGSSSKDALKAPPNPNHEHAALRTLPHSAVRVYKNGKLIGTAFENLLAFLPPASLPSKQMGARDGGFDDGLVGYFPAVSCFWGGIAELNFGTGAEGFWCPPAHLRSTPAADTAGGSGDVEMSDAQQGGKALQGWTPGRECRPIGERYKEQVAEDVVFDLVDEADFFAQDGGYDATMGKEGWGGVKAEN